MKRKLLCISLFVAAITILSGASAAQGFEANGIHGVHVDQAQSSEALRDSHLPENQEQAGWVAASGDTWQCGASRQKCSGECRNGACGEQCYVAGKYGLCKFSSQKACYCDTAVERSVYSNCEKGCSRYDTGTGYFIGRFTPEKTQTLAVSFTPTATTNLIGAIIAGMCYARGPCDDVLDTYIMSDSGNGPGKILAQLRQVSKRMPNYPKSAPLAYIDPNKKLTLHANTKYYLCQQIKSNATPVVVWMLSKNDGGPDLYYNESGGCAGAMSNDSGIMRPAFEIDGADGSEASEQHEAGDCNSDTPE